MSNMLSFLFNKDFSKSKAQLEKERKEYENLIFPFGAQHREKIKTLLLQIHSKKIDQIELIVSFIEGKQLYLENKNTAAICRLIEKKGARLKPEQVKTIIALIIMDSQCSRIEQLPTLEQVQNFALTIDI